MSDPVALRRFKYRSQWVEAGKSVVMPPEDERRHRLVGLIADAPKRPQRRRKRK